MVESTARFAQFEWDQAKTIFGDFRSRPTQNYGLWTKKNSVMKVVNMRGELRGPFAPPLQFRYPHCVPILVPIVLDRSHNLRMIREGRTNVTILV